MKPQAEKTQRLSITEWSVQDRPREKFANQGASALSDAELISILLRTGNATENAVELAKRLLRSCGNNLIRLSEFGLSDFDNIKGIGPAKAISLLAAFELGKRIRSAAVEAQHCINTVEDVIELMQDKIATLKHEEFWTIFLNQASKILSIKQISKGGLTSVTVDQRLILHEAIIQSATMVIVCHNHPSGSVLPSDQDKQLTDILKQALKTLNIKLLDHIIIFKDSYHSFAQEGIL